jgi:hypothetical protein
MAAKIFCPDVHRMIGNQGQISGHDKNSDPLAQFFGDQISETAHFPQTGVYGGGHQQKVVVPALGSFSFRLVIRKPRLNKTMPNPNAA